MPEFILKTETERRLYVEALFVCLERGTLSESEILEDLCSLIPGLSDQTEDDNACADFLRQAERILTGYRSGVQDLAISAERLVMLFNHPVAAGITAPSAAASATLS